MNAVEEVTYNDKVIAMIFRNSLQVDTVQFFTPQDNPFQVGMNQRSKGTHLPPHVHRLDSPLTITEVQEILYVVSGKIQVNLYTKDGTLIERSILTNGDSILLMTGGHGVDFLEDSKVFEVKQGPYPGQANAKIFVKEH